MTQYPKFVQPKYCPYALKQDEADALLTENNSMDPEEWEMFANSPLAGGDTTYENLEILLPWLKKPRATYFGTTTPLPRYTALGFTLTRKVAK